MRMIRMIVNRKRFSSDDFSRVSLPISSHGVQHDDAGMSNIAITRHYEH